MRKATEAEADPGLAATIGKIPISADNVQGFYAFLQIVLQDSQKQATTIALMHRDLQDIVSEVATLARILRDGNDSLMVRVAVIEKSVGQTADELKGIKAALESRSGEEMKGKWQIVAVTIGAGFTLLGIIITAIMGALVAMKRISP